MVDNLYILGDRPSFSDAQSKSTQFTVDDTWVNQDRYPRQVADINGDGRADIVGFAQDGVYVALANGAGGFSAAQVGLPTQFSTNDTWVSQDRYPRQLADVNGDGRADIVGFAQDAVYVALANGDGTFANATIGLSNNFTADDGGWRSQNQYPRQLADVNGDGRADIVGFGQDAVYVSLARGDGTFADATVGLATQFSVGDTWVTQDRYPRQLADVNGDGRADIVGFAQDAVYVALANGDGTFANAIVGLADNFTADDGGWTSQDQYPRQLADVNHDGRADIIGFGRDYVFVSLANGNGTFAAPTVGFAGFTPNGGGWTRQNQYPRHVADIDGDGQADLIGFGQNGVYVSRSTTQKNDILNGGDGNDILDGLTGNDVLNGGAGNDTLQGSVGNDILNGDAGDDALYGGAGDDALIGGVGADAMFGDIGDDIYNVDNASDRVTEYASQGKDTVNASISYTLTDNVEDLILYESALGSSGTGNNLANQIYGNTSNNTLSGQAGDDVLEGNNGNDSLLGDDGNDRLNGGVGDDYLEGGNGDDYLNGDFGNDRLNGGNGNDNIYGLLGDDVLNGGGGNDNLLGNNGNDRLVGGGGNDYLNGYGGTPEKDILTGGAGADRFVLGERIVEQNNLGQAFYNQTGKNDYALITDWDPKANRSDKIFDRVQLAGNSSQYRLNFARIGGIGGNAQDTEILLKVGRTWERVGIIEDSTQFNLNRDVVYI